MTPCTFHDCCGRRYRKMIDFRVEVVNYFPVTAHQVCLVFQETLKNPVAVLACTENQKDIIIIITALFQHLAHISHV